MAAARQTLLIAENDPRLLPTLKEYFQGKDFNVETASSLEEAKRKAQRPDIDIILTDLRLLHDNKKSDTSGLDVVREADPNVPVIIMSDFSPSEEFVQEVLVTKDIKESRSVYFINKEKGFEEILKSLQEYSPRRADSGEASAAAAGVEMSREKPGANAGESAKTDETSVGGVKVAPAAPETKGAGEAKTGSDVHGAEMAASVTEKESFFNWWRRKSPVFALILLLAALGMGILAMIFQDLLWLFGTVVAAILVVAVIGTAIE